jgi:Phage tail protein (Tail_P2_I)
MAGWDTDRPIYHRLPAESEAYQGNPIVDAVTAPFDELLVQWRDVALHFERDFLDSQTCKPEALDWLAQLCGFTGDYWDTDWPEAAKRELIARSHQFIWPNKGTQILLEYLLSVFAINAGIYRTGQFLAGISTAGSALGGELLQYWVLMPIQYRRTGMEWGLVERFVRLYMPCFVEHAVCYEKFHAGFSAAGEPVF